MADWLPALTPRRLRHMWYVPLLALAMGTMMLRLLLMARLLDVRGFGEFSGGILVSSTFCMLGCFGLQSMLQREWPVRIVRGQGRRALVLASQGVLVAAASAMVAGVGLLAMPWVSTTGALLVSGVVHGFSQQIFLLSTIESRSRGDALGFAWQNLLRSAIAFALSVLVAYLTLSPLAALWVDAIATAVLAWGFFAQSVRRSFAGLRGLLIVAWRRLPSLPWRVALTLMTVGIVSFVQLNADRWLAAERLDIGGFAQYSFAGVVLSVAQSAQAVINASVYPAVARRYAERGGAIAFRACWRASLALLILGTLLAAALWPLLEGAIDRWYPAYAGARSLVPVFLSIAVLRVSDFWSSFLLITGRERELLVINLAALGLAPLLWILLGLSNRSRIDILPSVGLLAMMLAAINYLGVVIASWRTRQQ